MSATKSSSCNLVAALRESYGLEVEEIPSAIESAHGETVQLLDGQGFWQRKLVVPVIGRPIANIPWNFAFENSVLEWAMRTFIYERIESSLDIHRLAPVISLIAAAPVGRDFLKAENKLEVDVIRDYFVKEIVSAFERKDFINGSMLRGFYLSAAEQEIPNFTEDVALELFELRSGKNRSIAVDGVAMLDPIIGPMSEEELIGVLSALEARSDLLRQRALCAIISETGARPVQLALLREIDLYHDGNCWRLNICSVKKKHRVRYHPSAMRARKIEDETAQTLKNLIENNKEIIEELTGRAASFGFKREWFDEKFRPIFLKINLTEQRCKAMSSPKMRKYVLFSNGNTIGACVRRIGVKLGLRRSPMAVEIIGEEGALLEFNAYRLRRTYATRLVMNGASMEEVAIALDHESVRSVRHYFRLSENYFAWLRKLTCSSKDLEEIRRAWDGRWADERAPSTGPIVRIGGWGNCGKGSHCEKNPVSSCYGCHSFEPLKSGDHKKALEIIIAEKEMHASSGSTTTPLRVLEVSERNALQLILLTEDKDESST